MARSYYISSNNSAYPIDRVGWQGNTYRKVAWRGVTYTLSYYSSVTYSVIQTYSVVRTKEQRIKTGQKSDIHYNVTESVIRKADREYDSYDTFKTQTTWIPNNSINKSQSMASFFYTCSGDYGYAKHTSYYTCSIESGTYDLYSIATIPETLDSGSGLNVWTYTASNPMWYNRTYFSSNYHNANPSDSWEVVFRAYPNCTSYVTTSFYGSSVTNSGTYVVY